MGSTSPLVAFAAGLLSFLSPCIIPLIPSYLTFIGGTTFQELSTGRYGRTRVIARTLLFVLGFTLVFTALGIAMSGIGSFFGRTSRIVSYAAGAVIVLFGLNIIFDFWKLLDTERRLHLERRPAGWFGSILVGMAFAAGWTPCVGPILASILFVAGTSGDVARGAFLLARLLARARPAVRRRGAVLRLLHAAGAAAEAVARRDPHRERAVPRGSRHPHHPRPAAGHERIRLPRRRFACRSGTPRDPRGPGSCSAPSSRFWRSYSCGVRCGGSSPRTGSRRYVPLSSSHLAVLSILTFLGVIDAAAGIAGWLMFQGL